LKTKFENNLGYESGPKMDTFDEKTRAVKSNATVPLSSKVHMVARNLLGVQRFTWNL
jgi:hypothetical protein